MTKRRCDNCGRMKETRGAKVCDKGHFICKLCNSDMFGARKCPLCRSKLK